MLCIKWRVRVTVPVNHLKKQCCREMDSEMNHLHSRCFNIKFFHVFFKITISTQFQLIISKFEFYDR